MPAGGRRSAPEQWLVTAGDSAGAVPAAAHAAPGLSTFQHNTSVCRFNSLLLF